MPATDLSHLVELEREGWAALAAGHGADFYREQLAPEAAMAFPFGVLTRAEAIDAMASAPPWATYELRDAQVVPLTPDAGVVVYAVEARREGQAPFRAVVSSTFVRDGDSWKLAFHQQSPPAGA